MSVRAQSCNCGTQSLGRGTGVRLNVLNFANTTKQTLTCVAGLSKCCKYHRTCAGGHPKFYTQHAKRTIRKNSKNIRTKQHKIIANRRELDLTPVFEPAISRLVTAQRIFHVDLGYAKIHPSIFIHNPRKFRSRPSTLYKHAISDMWAFPRQMILSLRFFPIILTPCFTYPILSQ